MSTTSRAAGVLLVALVPGHTVDLTLHGKDVANEEHRLGGTFKLGTVQDAPLVGAMGTAGAGGGGGEIAENSEKRMRIHFLMFLGDFWITANLSDGVEIREQMR